MSASDPIQPYPTEPGSTPPAPPAPTKRPRNTIALVALIVAILGFAFAVIEGAYLLGWVLLPIGFVLGLVGLFARDRGKGLAVAAVIVSVVGTIAGVVAFTSSMSRVVNESFRPGTTTVVPSPGATTTDAPAGSPATTASPAAIIRRHGNPPRPHPTGSRSASRAAPAINPDACGVARAPAISANDPPSSDSGPHEASSPPVGRLRGRPELFLMRPLPW